MDIEKEIRLIHKMPHNALRDDKLYHLYQYLIYLLDSEQIDREKYDVIKAMIGYKPSFQTSLTSDCEDSLYLLTCLYDEILNNASKYSIVQTNSTHIEIKKYLPYVIEFFKYLGVYEIYIDIKNSNLFYLSSNLKHYNFFGTTYNIGNGRSSIIVKNGNDFRTLLTIVHEIGHAYENYLKKDLYVRKNRYFDSECLSTAFEYLFIEFLRNNNLVDDNFLSISEKNNLIIDLSRMDNAYVYNNYTFEQQIKLDNNDLKIPIEEFNRFTIIKANSYNINKVDNTCILKKSYNYYGYGFLFAMAMRERFLEDEQGAKEYIQSFPKFIYYNILDTHFGRDLIKLIPDNEYINATNDYVDKVLSKK